MGKGERRSCVNTLGSMVDVSTCLGILGFCFFVLFPCGGEREVWFSWSFQSLLCSRPFVFSPYCFCSSLPEGQSVPPTGCGWWWWWGGEVNTDLRFSTFAGVACICLRAWSFYRGHHLANRLYFRGVRHSLPLTDFVLCFSPLSRCCVSRVSLLGGKRVRRSSATTLSFLELFLSLTSVPFLLVGVSSL